jgi:hypothetical protein
MSVRCGLIAKTAIVSGRPARTKAAGDSGTWLFPLGPAVAFTACTGVCANGPRDKVRAAGLCRRINDIGLEIRMM